YRVLTTAFIWISPAVSVHCPCSAGSKDGAGCPGARPPPQPPRSLAAAALAGGRMPPRSVPALAGRYSACAGRRSPAAAPPTAPAVALGQEPAPSPSGRAPAAE